MKKIRSASLGVLVLVQLLFLTAFLGARGTQAAPQGAEVPLLVDTQWLADNQDAPGLRIVEIGRSYEDYQAGHIPGAVFLDRTPFWDEVEGVAGMLPSTDTVVQALELAGIGNDSTVVIYDSANGLWASRLFWALEYLGHQNVHLLDGGWGRWVETQGLVSKGVPEVPKADFTPDVQPQLLATKEWILDNLEDPQLKVVDTRSSDEYSGEDLRADRGGHIPGAVNVNWVLNVIAEEGNVFLPKDELFELYDSQDITGDDVAVTMCQTGVRGAHTYFVLRYLGYEDVKLYDGSWAEWGNESDTPIN